MNFSIPKNKFSSILSNSNVFLSKNLKIYYFLNNDKKIGFIVSKKFGSAIQRNYFKRCCRNIFINNKNIKSTLIIKPLKLNKIKYQDLLKSFNEFSSLFA